VTRPLNEEIRLIATENQRYWKEFFEIFLAVEAGNIKREFITRRPIH